MMVAIVIGVVILALCSVGVLIIMNNVYEREKRVEKRELEIKAEKAKGKK